MKEIILPSSVLILVISTVRWLFRGRVRQRLIYGVWLLAALRLLIPVQFGSFRFSMLNSAQPLTQALTELSQDSVFGPSRQEVYQRIESSYIAQGQKISSPEVRQRIHTEVEQTITGPTLGQIATGIWLLGVVLMSLWFLITNLTHQRMLRREAISAQGLSAPIPVLVSHRVSSPCLVGLIHPVIYLTPESLRPQSVDHVLAHELTHYRHKDHIWALVRCLCLCVYWFHPLVWLAAFLSRRDCELACDEGALALLGEDQRIAYGKTLLHIVSHTSSHTHILQTATTMNESKHQLKERVNYIVKKPKVWITSVICMLLVCAICAGCAFAGEVKQSPEVTTVPTAPQETTESTVPAESTPTEPTTDWTEPNNAVALTSEQIQQVNRAFESIVTGEHNGLTYAESSVAGRFFTSFYSQPTEMDLTKFLYSYPGGAGASQEEEAALAAVLGYDPTFVVPCHKYSKSEIDEVLMKYMGITSDGMYQDPSFELIYLEKYDAYYNFSSDFLAGSFECISGEIYDNIAYLYSSTAVLTLVCQENGRWLIYSHMPLSQAVMPDPDIPEYTEPILSLPIVQKM